MRTFTRALCLTVLSLCVACGDDDAGGDDASTRDARASDVMTDGPQTDAPGRDGAVPRDSSVDSAVATMGQIVLEVNADQGAASSASVAVPFPESVLSDVTQLSLTDEGGAARPFAAVVLATWPGDESARSVLISFASELSADAQETLTLGYGVGGTPPAGVPSADPDGPAAVLVDVEWLAQSGFSGTLLPTARNDRFPEFDTNVTDALWSMSPAFDSYGVSCSGTSSHRTYYDSPHGMWFVHARAPSARTYRRAREESVWYRANELTWYEGRSMAVEICQGDGWTPATPIGWSIVRRMTSQGMLEDYLLTGDPAAREAVAAMGEAFVRNLPALRDGRENILRVTERNLAWPLMGVAAYYAIDHSAYIRDALDSLIEEARAWQAAGESGAFEHDIVRPDPDECSDGPAGGSPFMTSLLIDGLMDAYRLTRDERIPDIVLRTATWLRDTAVTPDGRAFRYLWGCRDNDYADSSPELNNLIVHVFGAAFVVSGDSAWLDVGDSFADAGVDAMYVGRPKQWSQTVRGFARYLGYRAEGR